MGKGLWDEADDNISQGRPSRSFATLSFMERTQTPMQSGNELVRKATAITEIWHHSDAF